MILYCDKSLKVCTILAALARAVLRAAVKCSRWYKVIVFNDRSNHDVMQDQNSWVPMATFGEFTPILIFIFFVCNSMKLFPAAQLPGLQQRPLPRGCLFGGCPALPARVPRLPAPEGRLPNNTSQSISPTCA
jgi:hypothetical protein